MYMLALSSLTAHLGPVYENTKHDQVIKSVKSFNRISSYLILKLTCLSHIKNISQLSVCKVNYLDHNNSEKRFDFCFHNLNLNIYSTKISYAYFVD